MGRCCFAVCALRARRSARCGTFWQARSGLACAVQASHARVRGGGGGGVGRGIFPKVRPQNLHTGPCTPGSSWFWVDAQIAVASRVQDFHSDPLGPLVHGGFRVEDSRSGVMVGLRFPLSWFVLGLRFRVKAVKVSGLPFSPLWFIGGFRFRA